MHSYIPLWETYPHKAEMSKKKKNAARWRVLGLLACWDLDLEAGTAGRTLPPVGWERQHDLQQMETRDNFLLRAGIVSGTLLWWKEPSKDDCCGALWRGCLCISCLEKVRDIDSGTGSTPTFCLWICYIP